MTNLREKSENMTQTERPAGEPEALGAPSFAVSITHLSKSFGQKRAVNDLSLNIPTGSFFGLVGPNGAGKTTTLNMTTGLLMPDFGNISILGQDVWSDVNRAKRRIGVMPEAGQLFDRLTGSQLLVYSGMLRGMKRAEAIARSRDLLTAFDLTAAADTMVTDYSAGMTKKIALATAMIHSPRILFLDEPFESVDPVSSANLRDILLEYCETGGTVIISSHVMALVEKMCSHVAVINKGTVRAAGTVAEVAAGEDLEDRFLDLVGGRHSAAHISWLNGGGEDHGAGHAPVQPSPAMPVQPLPRPARPVQPAQPIQQPLPPSQPSQPAVPPAAPTAPTQE